MKSKYAVAVVVLTWNNQDDIAECLTSLQKQTYGNMGILVVDNASTDNTVNIIQKQFPEISLLQSKTNLYFTGGFNMGINWVIKEWQPRYVMVINPDTKAEKRMTTELVKCLEADTKIGAAGPKVKFLGGKNNNKLYSCGIYFDGFIWATQRGHLEKDSGQYDKFEEVFGIEGTCILFRKEMLEQNGLFWEKLKMYLEDVELFLRSKKYGWKAVYCPDALLWHKVMQSTKQNKNLQVEKQKMRNWLLIAWRHYSFPAKLAMLKRYIFFKLNIW